ncbi:hypothetical protein KPL70_027037 [Citrus sinensis]|nr:hypothetical protein KPL70_027037 [Citrus sinensis]
MEPSPVHTTPQIEEEDEWDTDGFVIPSLGIGDSDQSKRDAVEVESSKPPSPKKLKEADRRTSGPGRENKVENLRELVGGGGRVSANMSKGSNRDWLDPHCHESQFERWNPQ